MKLITAKSINTWTGRRVKSPDSRVRPGIARAGMLLASQASARATASNRKSNSKSRKPLSLQQKLFRGAAGLLAAGLLFLIGIVWMTRTPPARYVALTQVESWEVPDQEEFETRLLELRNAARRTGPWAATFQQNAINQWLANDLETKFRASIPSSLSRPRVELSEDGLWIGVAFGGAWLKGVLSMEARIEITDSPNQIALYFRKLQVGTLPLPVAWFESVIRQTFQVNDMSSFWIDSDAGRVLLVTLPKPLVDSGDGRTLLLNEFTIEAGTVSLAGQTIPTK